MGYERVGTYWFCNDFEKFWSQISNGRSVIFTSDRLNGRFVCEGTRKLGGNKYYVKSRFRRENIRFLDPSCVINPEHTDIVDAAPPQVRWNLDILPVLTDVKAMFNSLNRKDRDKIRAIGDALARWDFKEDFTHNEEVLILP